MRILAFDTATTACSAAVWADGHVVARRFRPMPRGQAEALIPMVTEVMNEAGVAFDGLDLLAATIGPGAFTGLRIGLAAARGMALAAALPCLGVTTLEAVAEGVPDIERDDAHVLVALDAKRADVYAQLFTSDLEAVCDPIAALPADLAGKMPAGRLIVAGDAAEPVLDALATAGIEVRASAAPGVPDATLIAAIAARHWMPGAVLSTPAPLYLRPPDVTLSPNSGRLRP